MRNQETWQTKIRERFIQSTFSQRIIKDLLTIPDLEDTTNIESCFIHGPVHTGKTILASLMLLRYAKEAYMQAENKKMVFLKTSEMFNSFKATFNDPNKSEQAYLEKLTDADLLILDDFGMERPTDWILSILYLLVDRRYENMKTTIYTSNLSLEEIADKFGDDRITSRIERSCKMIKKITTYND